MSMPLKSIGILLIISAIGLLIPYTILTIIFQYPQILREDTGVILTRFYEGGRPLIFTWFAFALTGLPLIPAYIGIGQWLEQRIPFIRTATTLGVVGLVVQMIGLLRWTFVVPMLASTYMKTEDVSIKAAVIVAFNTLHQFAGVLLGEHLGQLLTILWTVMISFALKRSKWIPGWLAWLGVVASGIYLLAQLELLATVMEGIPVWDLAGFIGSTLWLLWLIFVGIYCIRMDKIKPDSDHVI